MKLLLAGDVSGLSEWELPLSFMTDERWLAVYEQTTEKAENCTPEFLFHYGVSLYENGHYKEGAAALQRSAAQKPCALTQRTIAHIAFTEGRDAEACDLMRKASAYPDFYLHKAFAEDYVQMLLRAERYEEAWLFLPGLARMAANGRTHAHAISRLRLLNRGNGTFLKGSSTRNFLLHARERVALSSCGSSVRPCFWLQNAAWKTPLLF